MAKYFPSKDDLQAAIDNAELYKEYRTRGELYRDVASRLGVNAGTLQIRVNDMGIMMKTQPAKSRLQKGIKPLNRTSRASKLAKFDTFDQIAANIPETFSHYVDKAKGGSLKAMVALKCIDCSGFQRREVTLCTQTDCALYPIRPFQGALQND